MKHVIWKFWKAWDFDREEQWLNQMAAQGLALTGVSFCRYEFEDCAPGAYTYRLELLKETTRHPESQSYIRFLEETGAKHVATFSRWVYFALPAALGPFELHSDLESKIGLLKRIEKLLVFPTVFCAFTGIQNLLLLFSPDGVWGNGIGFLNLAIALWAGLGIRKIRKKRRALEKEQQIFEA